MASYQPDCTKCKALCCGHIALEIDKPTNKQDYDNIRWYLVHKNVSVFIDHNKDWFIKFMTECEHVEKSNMCGIYEERPKICRDYPSPDEMCEFEGEEDYYVEIFETEEEFTDYLDSKGKKWRYKRL